MAMMQWCGAVARRVLATKQSAAFSSLPSSSPSVGAPIVCGRGDKRTKKGKRFKGSYGNSRPKKEKMIERIKDKVEVPRKIIRPQFDVVLSNGNLRPKKEKMIERIKDKVEVPRSTPWSLPSKF